MSPAASSWASAARLSAACSSEISSSVVQINITSRIWFNAAAGVAVMGQARGYYTFFAHLKWTWAIAIGYAASIYVHFLVNAWAFTGG